MVHQLPELPYAKNALAPHISEETINFHYGKHHQTYVNNLNKLIVGTEFENLPLDEIVRKASGGIFNNAAQIWNHTFYWRGLDPKGGGQAGGALGQAINKAFGSYDDFRKQFTQAAVTLFGSGWTWLVKNKDGSVAIEQTGNAGNPMTAGKLALLTCDVWEHAYYIDYRNARADYVESFWKLVNWRFAEKNYGA
ncbi:MAG TPA: Fe-Mn family superoxide dismutase [Candidatus Acidoferrum sp.]|nr:Fe-Mn family superoxide dismutase [Candidatus Acidoferrum sp.]